ncbi:hypothetical protein [Dysgonomonas macrotermitis]|uniref:Uncharacterized protein n=2 Tax=Dysgonomonas macrotermitis TaxID=1346286 RepID=A0A1M5AG34_9BACT|nr:hypothetical protein [Dysgonomonas macrotermitis]SHF29104.1 hypothetical protein SAMN05444362_10537 [Dysgonomonas macrotermitis]
MKARQILLGINDVRGHMKYVNITKAMKTKMLAQGLIKPSEYNKNKERSYDYYYLYEQ